MEERIEFLKRRKGYICGSDISAICGISKYKTPLDIFLDKTSEEIEYQSSEAAYFGNLFEDKIAEEYAIRTGNKISKIENIIISEKYPFAAANPDRFVNDGEFILEVKTISHRFMDRLGVEGTDQVPEEWLTQVAWYCMICEKPKAEIAVLVAGQTFKIYVYHRDKKFEEQLLNIVSNFWHNHVIVGVPPAPINSNDLLNLFPISNENMKTADFEIIEVIEELKKLKEIKKELDFEVETKELLLKNIIGENSGLVDNNGKVLVTWKNQASREYFDIKSFKKDNEDLHKKYKKSIPGSRVFLIKK